MHSEWAGPPPQLRLVPGEVHVWRARLDVGEPEFGLIAPGLTQDEHLHAGRLRFPAERRAFLVARAVLRNILGRYLGKSPAGLSFIRGAHGKPALGEAEAEWLRFNSSRSQNLALYAVAREREVGVDVERIQPELASWQLAAQFFAEGEIRALRQFGDELQTDAFFACWTRKEAYLKARGTGLYAPLDSFEVPVTRDGTPAVAFDFALDQPAMIAGAGVGWSLQSLDAGEGFAAACAAQGSDWRMHLWQWSPIVE